MWCEQRKPDTHPYERIFMIRHWMIRMIRSISTLKRGEPSSWASASEGSRNCKLELYQAEREISCSLIISNLAIINSSPIFAILSETLYQPNLRRSPPVWHHLGNQIRKQGNASTQSHAEWKWPRGSTCCTHSAEVNLYSPKRRKNS